MMNEFSLMPKEATEVVKDFRDDAKELGDKKIYKDTTVKDAAKTVVIAGMAYGTGGTSAVVGYVGSKVIGEATKELALEAGCSEQNASKAGNVARVIGGIATGAAVDGICGAEDAGEIGEIASNVADKVDTGVIDYDVPVAQAGELSDTGKNLIASDITNGVSELDLPVATNAEKINETVIGGKFEFNEGAVSEGVANMETNLIKLDTRNQALEGTVHPETGVPFERKVIDIGNNTKVEGVFPKFDSVIDIQLPEDMLKAPDSVQFPECNRQLKEAFEANPDKFSFDKEQMEQILDGETPDGYTWHHDAEVGKMQLVESDIHAKTGHTGGRVVWGGGNENR